MKRLDVDVNHKSINYGTKPQVYAMQNALETLGFRAEAINLDGLEADSRKRKLAYFNRN